MMTKEQIKIAFKKHLPVVVELRGANPGTYHYSYISALITRYNERKNVFFEEIEVVDTRRNSVMEVTADKIRLATAQELLNINSEGVTNKKQGYALIDEFIEENKDICDIC